MTTLLTSRPRVRDHVASQESLFGDWSERAAAAPVATPARPRPTSPERSQAPAPAPAAPTPASGPTLEAAVTSLWAQLTAGHPVACPVCDAAMEPRHTASAGVVGGRCGSCGSTLS